MRLLALLVAGALVLSAGQSYADEQDEKEKKAAEEFVKIGELNEAYVTAFNAKDVKKLATLFAFNADFTLLTGDTISSRKQIAGAHVSFFKNNPDAKISGEQKTRRMVRPTVVVATGIWKVENGPEEFASSGNWSTVVVKQGGEWKYTAMRLMVPAKASAE